MENRSSCEEWSVDENWFVTSPKNFFFLGDVKYYIKVESTIISIGFFGNIINLDMKEEENRDNVFQWLIKIKKSYIKASRKHQELHHQMQAAQLEIQNKIAGAVCK